MPCIKKMFLECRFCFVLFKIITKLKAYSVKLEIQKPLVSQLYLGLIYGGIGLLGFVTARFAASILSLFPTCMFHYLTGIPCPVCGATRSAILLSHFEIPQAFLTSPFFFILYIGLVFWGINSLGGVVFKKNIHVVLTTSEKHLVVKLLLWFMAINWLYLIFRELF